MKKIIIRIFIIKLLDSLLYGFNIHKRKKEWAKEIERVSILKLDNIYKEIVYKLGNCHPFSISANNRVLIRKRKNINN